MPASDVIYYQPNKRLQWQDFEGDAIKNHRAAAITVSGFGYKAEMKNSGGRGDLIISVYCFFNKPKSWVKEGHTTPYILAHEQNHFDITYLATNLFIEKLRGATFTVNNINTLLPKIYNESCAVMNRLQDDYDGQTKNGQVKDAQQNWNDMIKDKLDNMSR